MRSLSILPNALRVAHQNSNYGAIRYFSRSPVQFNKDMFCFQCEQTDNGTGCTVVGVCGKTPEVSRLQDLLMYTLQGVAQWAKLANAEGVSDQTTDVNVLKFLFSTLTNVNFDDARFVEYLQETIKMREKYRQLYRDAAIKNGKTPIESFPPGPSTIQLQFQSVDSLIQQAIPIGIEERKKMHGDDYVGLQELIVYGLKGMAAYAEHAEILGRTDPKIFQFVYETLAILARDATPEELLGAALKVGEANLRVMELLDDGATSTYGHPEPTKVRVGGVKGKAILVSGHDLKDVHELLKQTEGTGINIYTHGELLPAHAYPGLKKYKHLKGNYGGAWQHQKMDFALFPGPIVMTTNCIIEPTKRYKDRIYTRGVVGWPGVKHISNYDYSEVIERAKSMDGFEEDEPEKFLMTGFGRNAVLSVKDKVVEAVKSGAIKHFFVIGGCDGAEAQRDYFGQVAKKTPQDSLILTLACGKYRFNHMDLGTVAGLPRVLDMGQCNDSYSAIQVAVALTKEFGVNSVNDLPISFVISWFEQKAVAVLLTMLHLGIKKIYLGPRLPAFVTPAMLQILVDTFDIRGIGTPDGDLAQMVETKAKEA